MPIVIPPRDAGPPGYWYTHVVEDTVAGLHGTPEPSRRRLAAYASALDGQLAAWSARRRGAADDAALEAATARLDEARRALARVGIQARSAYRERDGRKFRHHAFAFGGAAVWQEQECRDRARGVAASGHERMALETERDQLAAAAERPRGLERD